MKKFLIFLTFFIVAAEGMGQQVSPPPTLFFQRLTIAKGLSQSDNYFIYKDTQGFVWLSSTSGLNRFDGHEIKVYRESLSDSTSVMGANVNGHFAEDHDGNLWFSTSSAVNCYLRKKDNFKSFTLKNKLGQPKSEYFTCGISGDNLWVINRDSLFRFDLKDEIFIPVKKLEKAHLRGKLQIGKNGKEDRLFFYGENFDVGLEVVSLENGEVTSSEFLFPSEIVNVLFFESDSLIWLIKDKELITFNPFNKEITPYPALLTEGGKTETIPLRSGSNFDERYLVLGSAGKGITFFDKITKQFSPFQSRMEGVDYSLIDNTPTTIYSTEDGDIWVSFAGQSIDFTNAKKLKFETILADRPATTTSRISSIFPLSDGNTWVSSRSADYYILNKKNEIIKVINKNTHPKLKSGGFYQFEDDYQRVWLLGGVEEYYYDLKTGKIHLVKPKLREENVIFFHGKTLQDGTILFSSFTGGFFKIENPSARHPKFIPVFPNDFKAPILAFTQSIDGEIYANEDLNQLIILDKNFQWERNIPLSGDFKCFYEKQNPTDSILWIGTDRGLVRLNKYNYQYKIFTEEDGLPNAIIYGIVPDENNNLWLSTNRGIVAFHLTDTTFTNYGIYDGMPFLEFSRNAFSKKENGEILFGSIGGLTVFHPDSIQIAPYENKPIITSININDEENSKVACYETKATNISEVQTLQLDYERNTVSFEFSAMDYGDPQNNQYRYQLEGQDAEVIEGGNRNFVRYSNLSPAHYVFKLWAANSDGVWSKEPVLLNLNISPPFWQRFWFIALCFLIGLAIVSMALRYYFRKELEKEIALEKQKLFWSRKMHEDLGADYSSLKIRLGMLFANMKKGKNVEQETKRIESLMETVSKQVRGIIWSMNFKNDKVEKMMGFFHQYATQLFEDTPTNLRFPLPSNLPKKEIKGERRMTVLHVFKEALNNIQKHAQATEVNITVESSDTEVFLSVQDNGVGFNASLLQDSTGNGLTNMQERMEEIGGSCKIDTSKQGTAVLFSFPI